MKSLLLVFLSILSAGAVMAQKQLGGYIRNNAHCEGLMANFSVANTQEPIETYYWDFGAGVTSSMATPNHTYTKAGEYKVTAILYTATGKIDTLVTSVQIGQLPVPFFTASVTEGCNPFPVNFKNQTKGEVLTYMWNFGNYETSRSIDPIYTYRNGTKSYDVSLTAISPEGCEATVTRLNYIDVHGQPTAGFNFQLNSQDQSNVFSFQNLSVQSDTYLWDFGDGTTSNIYAPTHEFPADSGTYKVTLRSSNAYGCYDMVSQLIHVTPAYTIYIPNTFSPNEDALNDVFMVHASNVKNVSMDIFNAFGKPVFHQDGTDPMEKGWTGIENGSGTPAEPGVYTYKIIATDEFNIPHEFVGQVNLMR